MNRHWKSAGLTATLLVIQNGPHTTTNEVNHVTTHATVVGKVATTASLVIANRQLAGRITPANTARSSNIGHNIPTPQQRTVFGTQNSRFSGLEQNVRKWNFRTYPATNLRVIRRMNDRPEDQMANG